MSEFTVTPENCSKEWGNLYNPLTGEQTSIPLRCGKWRDQECPICFNLRLEEMRKEIVETSKIVPLRAVSLELADELDIKSELSKEARRKSVLKTSFLEPTTIGEAEKAVTVRAACFCEEIERLGGKVTARKYIKLRVDRKQPTWDELYSDLNLSFVKQQVWNEAWNAEHPRLQW